MLSSKVSRILLGLGAAIGIVGAIVWALEIRVNLPDWMVRVALLKLAFLGSAGLLTAGAVIGRHANTRSLERGDVAALGRGEPDFPSAARQPDAVSAERRNTTP